MRIRISQDKYRASRTNETYANPRPVILPPTNALISAYFVFEPYFLITGIVQSPTGDPIQGINLVFTTTNLIGEVINKYPHYASYATPWETDSTGNFPSNSWVPVSSYYDLTLSHTGYTDTIFTNIINNPLPGGTNDFELLVMAPLQNPTNPAAGLNLELIFAPHSSTTNQFVNFLSTSTNTIFTWSAASSHIYSLMSSDNLMSTNWTLSKGPWTTQTDQMQMQLTVPIIGTLTQQYYCIEIQLP